MSEQIISSASELSEATEYWKAKRTDMLKGDLLNEWTSKFFKHTEKTIKEAVKQGLYSCSIYLPYQPEKKGDAWKGIFVEGIDIRVWVKKQVPGCSVEYVLEPMDGVTGGYFVLEISWSC